MIPQTPLRSAFFSLVALGTLAFTPALRAGETTVWLAEEAEVTSGTVRWPDTKGTFTLEMEDATGVSIGAKSAGAKDAKSFELSGEQVLALRTDLPLPSPAAGLKVNLRAFISESTSEDTTLLRHGSQWELRYSASRQALIFIIWHGSNEFTEVRTEANPGHWQEVTLEYAPTMMKIKVDSNTAEQTPKDVMTEDPKLQPLLMGASSPRPVNGPLPRAFKGAFADIHLTIE